MFLIKKHLFTGKSEVFSAVESAF